MQQRYVELDLLRTLAIVMMVIYHLAYDLEMYHGFPLGLFENTSWYLLRQGTASLFLLLVGTSFAISWNRHQTKHGESSFAVRYKKYVLRGLGVIGCGMLVSMVTYVAEPETYVRFGILHMIGVSILLLPFFARFREWNLLLGISFIGFQKIIVDILSVAGRRPALLPLGVMPTDFMSVDYFPLIPWFGIVLMGYAVGYFLYVRQRGFRKSSSDSSVSSDSSYARRRRALTWPGKNALLIYLLHQPLILGLLALLSRLGFV